MLLPEKTSVIGTMQYILPNEKVIPKYLYYVIRYMHFRKNILLVQQFHIFILRIIKEKNLIFAGFI